MNTWTFKRSICALFLGLSLAACDTGGEGFRLVPKTAPEEPETEERRNVALVSAMMMDGAVKLVPPDGYCIDKTRLRQNFAILARCDSLGGKGGALDAPLGVISVALTPLDSAPDLAGLAGAGLARGSVVLERRSGRNTELLQVSGGSVDGGSEVHWQGLGQLGPFLVGLRAFGPEAGAISGATGAFMLEQMMQRMQDARIALDVVNSPDKG